MLWIFLLTRVTPAALASAWLLSVAGRKGQPRVRLPLVWLAIAAVLSLGAVVEETRAGLSATSAITASIVRVAALLGLGCAVQVLGRRGYSTITQVACGAVVGVMAFALLELVSVLSTPYRSY